MNLDKIMLQLGVDSSAVASGLAAFESKVNGALKSVGNSFKNAFSNLLAPLSVAGVVAGFGKVLNMVEHISEVAKSRGISTDLVQDLDNIGSAAGIASEKIDSMFTKWMQKLPVGADVEKAFYAQADAIAAIEDPVARAQMAIDKFGKSGMDMLRIVGQGSEGIKKMGAEFSKFSRGEIISIQEANDNIDAFQNKLTKLAGMVIGGAVLLKNFGIESAKAMSFRTGFINQAAGQFSKEASVSGVEEQMKAAEAATRATERINAARTALAAYNRVVDDLRVKSGTAAEKIDVLNRRLGVEQQAALNSEGSPEEWVTHMEKALNLEEQIAKVREDSGKASEEERQKATEAAEKRRGMERDILATKEKIAQQESQNAASAFNRKYGEVMPSMQELSEAGIYRQQANRYMWLKRDANLALRKGNTAFAEREVEEMRGIMGYLRDSGVQPKDTMAGIEEATKASQTHLAELLRKANAEGLNIAPTMGK